MDQKKIGSFISELRKNKKLTQKQLADLLGVSDRTISKWENGRGLPDYTYLKDLCNILGISLNEFLEGERIPNENYQQKLEQNLGKAIMNNSKLNKNYFLLKIITCCITVVFAIAIIIFFNIEERNKIYRYQILDGEQLVHDLTLSYDSKGNLYHLFTYLTYNDDILEELTKQETSLEERTKEFLGLKLDAGFKYYFGFKSIPYKKVLSYESFVIDLRKDFKLSEHRDLMEYLKLDKYCDYSRNKLNIKPEALLEDDDFSYHWVMINGDYSIDKLNSFN